MGPGDSKLLCGPTTIIEEKERCDRKGRKRARKYPYPYPWEIPRDQVRIVDQDRYLCTP